METERTFYVVHWVGDGYNRQHINPKTKEAFLSRNEAITWAVTENIDRYEVWADDEDEHCLVGATDYE